MLRSWWQYERTGSQRKRINSDNECLLFITFDYILLSLAISSLALLSAIIREIAHFFLFY